MRFVIALFAACLLMLTLVNGTPAGAASQCQPAGAEATSHFHGDADEVPDCPLADGGHHHHSVSGEHQLAVSDRSLSLAWASGSRLGVLPSRDTVPSGLTPASELRPPIA